jgi:YVTN family beta-propeller protein
MGRKVTPVGKLVGVPYFPLAVAFSPDGKLAYVVHSGQWAMDVVDVEAGEVVASVADVGGFRGVAVSHDGQAVYTAEAAHGTLTRMTWQEGTLVLEKKIPMEGVPTDVELTAAGDRVIAVSAANSTVWELDSETMGILTQYQTRGVYPYALALTPDESKLLVTHVGDDTLTVIDRSTGEVVKNVQVGLNPMGLVVDSERGRAIVANSDSDSLSIVSLIDFTVRQTIDVSGSHEALPGGTPNEMALAPDGSLLFVSFADLNRVEVFALPKFERLGAVPTGFYPTGLAVSKAGDRLAVVCSKGWGGATKLKKEESLLAFIDLPIDPSDLGEWTGIAERNVLRTTQYWDVECPDPIPRPLDLDEEPVVEHVVLIVRENKTYDAVFGDFERGNGDPNFLIFGQEVTPNIHALAERFVNLDNYYTDSQESFQGHTWTTQADCNDFFEKLYPSTSAQVLLAGWDPSSVIAERSIFDHLFDNGLTFRNYGEYESFTKDMFTLYEDFIDLKFPYFNMAIKDVWKAEEFIRELELGIFPQFVYIALPNDHTAGSRPGFPTPTSMVADNDEATGMIVDAISHSPYWDDTAIFIIEDDPQGCGDSVHSHRSICVAIGPWLRKGYTSSVHYSIPALYRTFEMLLRLPPMHKNDAFAPPMYDIFVSGEGDDLPDSAPYEHIPRLVPEVFNGEDGRLVEESMKLNLSEPDANPGLGCLVWRIVKGDKLPPAYGKKNDR